MQQASVTHFELQRYSSNLKSTYGDKYPYSSRLDCGHSSQQRVLNDARNNITLYRHAFESDPATALRLLTKIQDQSASIELNELERLIIPLINQMPQVVDHSLAETSHFYKSVMETYTLRTVGKEPEKPTTWARPGEVVGNRRCIDKGCADCKLMSDFMGDPTKETRHFDSLADPSHFEDHYYATGKCTVSNRHLYPIVTKTTKAWEEAHAEWQNRVSKAQETFQRLPQTELKQFWEIIMKQSWIFKLSRFRNRLLQTPGMILLTQMPKPKTRQSAIASKPGLGQPRL